jgi:transposase
MNTDLDNNYAACVAIDWADTEHVFILQQAGGQESQIGTLEQKPEAIGPWVAGLQERFKGGRLAVGLEQSRGALIHALMAYDFIDIYPIPSTMVAKYRQAFKPSDAKNDLADTRSIMEIITLHRDQLRVFRPDTQETRLLARLVADRRKAVEIRTAFIQSLVAALKEYFPLALQLLSGNVTSRLACDLLLKWPTLEELQQAKPATLKKFYYGHNIRSAEFIDNILNLVEKAKPLTTDCAIVESGRRLVELYARQIQTINPSILEYEQRIKDIFNNHPEASIFSGIPGAGKAMAPRLLAAFGTDRTRFETAENLQTFCGIAPVTKSSGRSQVVYMRRACPKFIRQTFHEFARLSVTDCQWARNFVEHKRSHGKGYHAAIRALAYKWIRVLFACWKNKTAYNEASHMKMLEKRGSIYAALHLKNT